MACQLRAGAGRQGHRARRSGWNGHQGLFAAAQPRLWLLRLLPRLLGAAATAVPLLFDPGILSIAQAAGGALVAGQHQLPPHRQQRPAEPRLQVGEWQTA